MMNLKFDKQNRIVEDMKEGVMSEKGSWEKRIDLVNWEKQQIMTELLKTWEELW